MNGNTLKKEFGDYQTPKYFAEIVCKLLRDKINVSPEIIIEPTSGIGNFLQAAINTFSDAKKFLGLEINPYYCDECKCRIPDKRLRIVNENFFTYEIEKNISNQETLFIGNPPWATNSDLNYNLPIKENFKHLIGTDAITGASNFDICEYIILKIIEKSVKKNVTIAMLCKTSVARNILLELDRNATPVDCVEMFTFDAGKIFGISASACLLLVKMSVVDRHINSCDIYDINFPAKIVSRIFIENGKLKTEVSGVEDFDGISNIEWRQGVKHDCAGIMELMKRDEERYINKNKEEIVLEDTLVFPLMKSSAFKKPIIKSGFSKYVIVTQKKAREDTDYIEELAPLTWKYLCENKAIFDARKSSIYKDAPAFSMFGVGDYSYAEYKVGISGFYKKPMFTLLYNEDEISHPIMVDDTVYFLSFDNYSDAYTCMLLLNSKKVQHFLYSISFQDAKRPYTKKVLQRLDMKKCVKQISFDELVETEDLLGLDMIISEEMYNHFIQQIGV